MSQRGELTSKVQAEAFKLLGYEITTSELRLMPYINYILQNDRKLDIRKINKEDRKILSKWRSKKFIEGGASIMHISKEFWDIMSELLFLAYVNYD